MIAVASRKRPRKTGIAAAQPAPLPGGNDQSRFVARLVPLEPGFYAVSLAAETRRREPEVGLALPAVHVCAPPPQDRAIEITDSFGRAGAWLGGRPNMLFVRVPVSGGTVLVTAYLARDPQGAPPELEIRRVGPAGPATPAPLIRLRMAGPAAAAPAPQRVSVEVVAHIRGRGDVRFVDTPWIGRLGPGLWIEALTIVPRDPSVHGALEYKGLTADGAETPWLGSGSLCGTTGQAMPLVGFAVRQKADAGRGLLDCEYAGYFRSGARSGPMRNGAPCRSAIDDDPLEGLQLQITPRPAPAARPRSRPVRST